MVDMLVPVGRMICGSGVNSRKSVTIHETGNRGKGANARAHARLQYNGNSRNASWHWTVDDEVAIRSYQHNVQCFHAGNGVGNRTSISIEICVNIDGDYNVALDNAARLTAKILREEGLDVDDVRQHNSWSGKNCPTIIRETGRWKEFLSRVAEYYSPKTEGDDIMSVSYDRWIADFRYVVDTAVRDVVRQEVFERNREAFKEIIREVISEDSNE